MTRYYQIVYGLPQIDDQDFVIILISGWVSSYRWSDPVLHARNFPMDACQRNLSLPEDCTGVSKK